MTRGGPGGGGARHNLHHPGDGRPLPTFVVEVHAELLPPDLRALAADFAALWPDVRAAVAG